MGWSWTVSVFLLCLCVRIGGNMRFWLQPRNSQGGCLLVLTGVTLGFRNSPENELFVVLF